MVLFLSAVGYHFITPHLVLIGLSLDVVPAEVQEGAGRGWNALCRPAQEVELCEGACFLGLNIL